MFSSMGVEGGLMSEKISSFFTKRNLIIMGAVLGAVVITIIIIVVVVVSGSDTVKYKEIEGFLGNPLKGFPGWPDWPWDIQDKYPYSMGYIILALYQIWPEENYINYTKVDEVLNDCAKNKRQCIVRINLDMPNQEWPNTPDWVFNKVQKVNWYEFEGKWNKAVNYNDETCLQIIETLHTKLGEKFNGDPRLAYWQLGTYGHWAEFHEYMVAEEDRATEQSVDRIFFSCLNAFPNHRVQVRYPSTRCINSKIGFYHDTFSNPEHDHWMDRDLNETNLWDRYKTEPFGGVITDEHRQERFKEQEEIDRFSTALEKYHPSYLMDYDFYDNYEEYLKDNPRYLEIRNKFEYRMGYNYYLKEAKIKKSSDSVEIEFNIYNKGVAPFYDEWIIVFGILRKDENGALVVDQEFPSDQNIKGVLEGETKKIHYKIEGIKSKKYILGFRVPSPIDAYVLFSNKEQKNQKEGGWFILKEFK